MAQSSSSHAEASRASAEFGKGKHAVMRIEFDGRTDARDERVLGGDVFRLGQGRRWLRRPGRVHHGQSRTGTIFQVFWRIEDGPSWEVTAKEVDISAVRLNDFLAPAQFFEQMENSTVPMIFDESDGSLEAQPSTFGDLRWGTKEIVREIRFVWNGVRFRETIIPER